jgi:hypothetical protein
MDAQGEFSRLSQQLGDVLLPDATDASASKDLILKLVESSPCKVRFGTIFTFGIFGHSSLFKCITD